MLVRLCESHSLLDLRAYIETLSQSDWGKYTLRMLANDKSYFLPSMPLIFCVKEGYFYLAKELLESIDGISVDRTDTGRL